MEVMAKALPNPARRSGAAARIACLAAGEMSLARSVGKAGAACAAEVTALPVLVLA